MQIAPECPACLGIQLFQALSHRNFSDWSKLSRVVFERSAPVWENGEHPGEALAELYRTLAERDGGADPYREAKDRANRMAEAFWAAHPLELDDCSGRALWAAAGNQIDAVLASDAKRLMNDFVHAESEGWGRNDWDAFAQNLTSGTRVIYLPDNAGEAVFDRELIRALAAKGVRISVLIRPEPVLNDVTVSDARDLGMDRVSESVVATARVGYGFDSHALGPAGERLWRSADAVIAKGIANLESLSHRSDRPPAVFLYRSKCPPSARMAGVAVNQTVAWASPA